MNKRRLLKLAELLEADAKNKKGVKFDLLGWGRISNPHSPVSCGTTACAVGLAAISGAFRRQGLGYRINRCGRIDITLNGRCVTRGARPGSYLNAMKFFDLQPHEADHLFVPYTYGGLPKEGAKGERVVAERIREFIAKQSQLSDHQS